MNSPARLDHQHVWHPFTQMRDWLRQPPRVITSGRGAVLRDDQGREYLDANASIWTNLHGHRQPALDAAIRGQLRRIAHSSALGLASEPASLLAGELVQSAQAGGRRPRLNKVFYSDDGSTALETALKMAYEFTRRTRGKTARPRFLSLAGAYHGDTLGAVSLGHVKLFHAAWRGLLFPTDAVMAPYCYRCPFNRARPERADAREYRVCQWECVRQVERRCAAQARRGNPYAGFVFEPLMQGAAGVIAQPPGWLRRVTAIARASGALLIADEVMTGFGRVNAAVALPDGRPALFACQEEGVRPDFLCLAKGLTGGYLPMAATLTTQAVFNAFLGDYGEFKTFFHGHSYTANQLGAAAARASLALLRQPARMAARQTLADGLREELQGLWTLRTVGDIRQNGRVAGIELVKDWRTREPFALRDRAGIRVCEAMARRGVLTRPVGNVILLMPPYCATPRQVRRITAALAESILEVLEPGPGGRPKPPVRARPVGTRRAASARLAR